MDRARNLYPIAVTFSEGELPTKAKLNAIGSQAKAGLDIVGYMLGDLWNQSGDPVLTKYGITNGALMIPNIGRVIGATNYLNPLVPYLSSTIGAYTFSFSGYSSWYTGRGEVGREVFLTFPVASGSTFTWSGTGTPTSRVSSRGAVKSAGQWYVDYTTGECAFFNQIQSDWKLTYKPRIDGDTYIWARNTVVPDINTNTSYAFKSCKIAYANGEDSSEGYVIYLPPRGPLRTTSQFADRSPQDSYTHSNTNNESTTPDTGTKLVWQRGNSGDSAATAAGYASHYRYNLPWNLTYNWTQNAQLPMGYLYLWDHSQTGTFIEGVAFRAENATTPSTWKIYASGVALDNWVTSYMDLCGYPVGALKKPNEHTADFYPAGGLRLVAPGMDIATLLQYLVKRLGDHDHGNDSMASGTGFLTRRIRHDQLALTRDRDCNGVVLSPSVKPSDDHVQYLHRMGYSASGRDLHKNMMLGTLMMGSTGSSGNYENTSSDSHVVGFGSNSTGPKVGYKSTEDMLAVTGKQLASHLGFRAYPVYYSKFYGVLPNYEYSTATASEGYGELRMFILKPSDWLAFNINTVGAGSYYSAGLSESRYHIQSYDYSSSGPESMTLRLDRDGGTSVAVLFSHIILPYKEWCLVNVRFAIKPRAWSLTSGTYKCAVGYETVLPPFPPFGSVSSIKSPAYTAETDLYNVQDTSGNPWNGVGANTWSGLADIFDKKPVGLVFVNNGLDPTAVPRVPWVRITATGGTADRDIDLSHVIAIVRIKEF